MLSHHSNAYIDCAVLADAYNFEYLLYVPAGLP